MQRNWINGVFLIFILSMLYVIPAVAEDQQSASAVAGNVADYSDDKLKSFIIANAGIYQVQQQADIKLQNMESDEQKQELVKVANQQMEQVLQGVGLTADEYNTMGQTIQSDTQLQEKINSIALELIQEEEE